MNGTTTTEFSQKTGFNRTYLSKYLNLKLDKPPSPNLLKSIAGNEVSYEELMVSCGYLDTENFSLKNTKKVPVIGTVHAGEPMFATENIENYEFVDSCELSPSYDYFYLRVKGDSMKNARIYEGDLVFVRKQSNVESGDIAVVIIDDDSAAIKRIIKKGEILILQAENPEYPPYIFTGEECSRVEIIGKVLHVKFKV